MPAAARRDRRARPVPRHDLAVHLLGAATPDDPGRGRQPHRADVDGIAARLCRRGRACSPWPAAFIVPSAIAVAVGAGRSRTAPFATWYLGGIGALMTIVMVRRRPWIAWIGIAALAVASMAWMGPAAALALGLVGSIVWVAATQLLLLSMDRAARDTAQLAQLQRAASAWQASQSGRQRERRVQVQRALAVAGPVLTRTVASGGALDEEERTRGAPGRRAPARRDARRRDCSTTRCAPSSSARAGAARTSPCSTRAVSTGSTRRRSPSSAPSSPRRCARRAPTGSTSAPRRTSRVAVTVVGRSATGPGLSDEDAVDLWREIASPGRSREEVLAPRPGGGGEPGRGAESEEARGGEAARPSPGGRLPENRPRGRT